MFGLWLLVRDKPRVRSYDVSAEALYQKFGQLLRAKRLAKGLTQRQLADATELSWRYVQELESGTKAPSLLTIVRISKALGIAVGELLFEIEDVVDLPNPAALAPRVDRRRTAGRTARSSRPPKKDKKDKGK